MMETWGNKNKRERRGRIPRASLLALPARGNNTTAKGDGSMGADGSSRRNVVNGVKMLNVCRPSGMIRMRPLPSLFLAPRPKLPSDPRPLTFVIIIVVIEVVVVVEEEAGAELFQ